MTNRMLSQFGTIAFSLPPQTILKTAEIDMRRRASNVKHRGESFERYAFVAKHVRRAKSVSDLIQRALNDQASGFVSAKAQTVALYRDQDSLRAALALAEQKASAA